MDRTLIDIAKQVGVKVIATNDFHYLRREDAPVQDVIMCIGMNAKVDDPNRMRMTGSEFYMKTEEEMRAMFPYCPEACDNTLEIADKCYVELDWDSIILPRFPLLDPGETHESQFRRECEKQYGENAALNPNNIIESKKFEITTPEVKISIAPENSYMIEARVINGRKYLLIPADDGVEVNGSPVTIPNPQA